MHIYITKSKYSDFAGCNILFQQLNRYNLENIFRRSTMTQITFKQEPVTLLGEQAKKDKKHQTLQC